VSTHPIVGSSATAGSAVPATATTAPALEPLHDATQQARNLRLVLQDDKQRIGCFLGAGCPLGIYDAGGTKTITLIPAVVELTKQVAEGLLAADNASKGTSEPTQFRTQWDSWCKECQTDGGKEPTVEDVLTELRAIANRRGTAEFLGMSKAALTALDEKICSLITERMNKVLPSYRCSYNHFASWVGGVYRTFPVEIFTPNYDLLFEQAFEQHPLPHFDGFVGSREPWFDLSSIEHDAIPARWTRLWKLHGSINWERREETVGTAQVARVVRVTGEAKEGKVMIFPSHLKYDQSRRMPYLAMLDRLKAFFHGSIAKARGGSGRLEEDAPRLIICGYSFLDDHLNEVLLDGLRGNRNAQCFALMYSDLEDHPRAVQYAEKQANLTVLAKNGAVVGTRVGLYRPGTPNIKEHSPWLYEEVITTSGAPVNHLRCRLGDFHYFGLFLEQLCGTRSSDAQPII
jgi:hypothetical protein